MNSLPEIIAALRRLVIDPDQRCGIRGGGTPDESSLLGTKDGYLNLAIALLEIASAGDDPMRDPIEFDRLDDEPAIWGNRPKRTLDQLPTNDCYIVGSYLFDDRPAYLAALGRRINPALDGGSKLGNDPDFRA